jgi:hypothetical protein
MNAADNLLRHMRATNNTYADAVAVVTEVTGAPAFIVNLGGGGMGIQAPIEGGWLWVTDAVDTLPTDRTMVEGWLVCTYAGDPAETESQDALRSDETVWDPELDGLRDALKDALARFHR